MTTWSKGYGEQRRRPNGNWKAKADQTAKRKRTRLRTKVMEQAVSSKIMEIVRENYERWLVNRTWVVWDDVKKAVVE